MKDLCRIMVAATLAFFARLVIRKYHPKIIMITGSVGKTSTKDAVYAALRERSYVRASEKSFNSEFGVPLTILGAANPWSRPFAWIRVFMEAFALILLPNHYPKALVLEVGADRPGDLAKILRIALPDAVVVTRLPEVPVHVEAYTSPAAVREEEFIPAYGLMPGAPLVLLSEDSYARTYAAGVPAVVTTFGFSGADVEIRETRVWIEEGKAVGMESSLHIDGQSYPLRVRGAIGRPQLLAPASAVALSIAMGLDIDGALAGLASYVPPPGRARLLSGKRGSALIDDSYNASPAAAEEALSALKSIPAKRHIAVLADMLELGRYSVKEHERVGALVPEFADVLIAVGIRSKALAEAARVAGMSEESVIIADNADAAATLLLSMLEEGDAVLIKGSQSMRMERVTAALLQNPAEASELVRQEHEWKRR